ncbi:MAG: Smr/MutS family protein [Acidobacteria bacterium]|nr:Smr/MutS family protein [Acidobacteriota bacterium]
MNERTLKTLELDAFLALAARHAETGPGRERILHLEPATSRAAIVADLDLTGECADFLSANGRFGLAGVRDPAPIVRQLQIEGTSLDPKQILQTETLLSSSIQIKSLIKNAEPAGSFPNLRRIAASIPDAGRLLAAIEGKILPNGELDDNASSELRLLRRDLTDRRARIHRALESILRSRSQAVQEEIITFRNDRFVIPVRTDSRNQIPGVVHGLSSSGQTTFIEPLTVINQNNDLVRLHEREILETNRILAEITGSLRSGLQEIRSIIELVTVLDAAQAKALLAAEFQCSRPEISENGTCRLCNARNILLESSFRDSGSRVVPISLDLDRQHPVLVISGPNAGGKTVALKTLGLLSLMAQTGFHLPVQNAVLPAFKKIFADIGDQQSMAASLSTFTAHMRNIAEMDGQLDLPALVLLDEVGTGTDPEEGAALAIAIIDYFHRAGATTVASTHYPRLKMWASQTDGVRNASVEFDEKTLQPTYRLMLGVAGASSGVEIARRMLVPEEILSRAQSLVEPSYAQAREYLRQLKETLDAQQDLRSALDSERAAVARKYSSLEKDFADLEKKREREFARERERLLEEFRAESDRALRGIKDRAEAARMKKNVQARAAALGRIAAGSAGKNESGRAGSGNADPDEVIAAGDRVKIRSLDREGSVESINNDTFTVAIGSVRYRAGRSDLSKISRQGESAPARDRGSWLTGQPSNIDGADEAMSPELKVIGMTADEAVARVDKFLDQAFLAGEEQVRIIHGHGKGILRRAIAELLENHLQVKRFGPAPQDQGGGGATIVELKQ